MESVVSNEVLLAKLESMAAVVLANNTVNHEAHQSILAQVTKTNGRVTTLEKTKNMLVGGLLFINIIIVPIFMAFVYQFIEKK